MSGPVKLSPAKRVVGDECDDDDQCSNKGIGGLGACGRVGRASNTPFKYECCDKTTTRGFRDYCVQPGGSACDEDFQCDSGHCSRYKMCVPLKDVDEICIHDSDCKNDACGRVQNPTKPLGNYEYRCCNSGQTRVHGFSDYCVQHRDEKCEHDAQCAERCNNNNMCEGSLKQLGDSCAKNAECYTQKCAQIGADLAYRCCDTVHPNQSNMCWGEGGAACGSRSNCKSAECLSNNKCQARQARGGVCKERSNCFSFECENGTCV